MPIKILSGKKAFIIETTVPQKNIVVDFIDIDEYASNMHDAGKMIASFAEYKAAIQTT